MFSKYGFFNVYWGIIAVTAVLAWLFKSDKKKFVIASAIVHVLACGLRYEYTTGDLRVYKRGFLRYASLDWSDSELFDEGRNSLFYVFNKTVAHLTNNNYQVLLFLISLISIASISILIYRYSNKPFISYLMWSCFGFYLFSFSGIKQTMAMAFVMFAAIGIFEKSRILFYLMVIIAGFVHMPAFIFLPSYELCRAKRLRTIIWFYIIFAVIIILFRNEIVNNMAELYYEGEKYIEASSFAIGGKTIMMITLLIVGIGLCNIRNEQFRYVFILIATASLIQMFSVYNNVFSRLADYYFQFIILYASFILDQRHNTIAEKPPLKFNSDSRKLITVIFAMLAMLYYFRVEFSFGKYNSAHEAINNFSFCWEEHPNQ